MKIDTRRAYLSPRELRETAIKSGGDYATMDKRRVAGEYARRNGYKKEIMTISGIRRVYYSKNI